MKGLIYLVIIFVLIGGCVWAFYALHEKAKKVEAEKPKPVVLGKALFDVNGEDSVKYVVRNATGADVAKGVTTLGRAELLELPLYGHFSVSCDDSAYYVRSKDVSVDMVVADESQVVHLNCPRKSTNFSVVVDQNSVIVEPEKFCLEGVQVCWKYDVKTFRVSMDSLSSSSRKGFNACFSSSDEFCGSERSVYLFDVVREGKVRLEWAVFDVDRELASGNVSIG